MLSRSRAQKSASSTLPKVEKVDGECFVLCLYCPSLCRHACPVATHAETDTLSPQRLMSLADHLRRGRVPPSPEIVEVLHACTGCGACTAACRHDNPVAQALVETRAALCEAGESPYAAEALTYPRLAADDPFFEALRPLSRYQDRPAASFVPGLRTVRQRPGEVMDLFTVCERLDVDALACGELARLDPGFDLWHAGHHAAFVEVARRFALAAEHASDIVVHSAETLFLLRDVYPRFGVRLPGAIVHVSEFLLPVLSGAVVKRLSGRIGYHESCHLARHLGLSDVPRQVLRRVIEGPLVELPARADITGCCGGTGLHPRDGLADGRPGLLAATAAKMADAALDAATRLGLERLVSFSPECVEALQAARARRAEGPRVEHAVTLVAEAVLADGMG